MSSRLNPSNKLVGAPSGRGFPDGNPRPDIRVTVFCGTIYQIPAISIDVCQWFHYEAYQDGEQTMELICEIGIHRRVHRVSVPNLE